MTLRMLAAILAGKISYSLLRLRGSGGGALPGLIAERLDPALLAALAAQCDEGLVLICGTNGKTTTSRLLSDLLADRHPVHNRSGSNLLRGHLSAFLEACGWNGRLRSRLAILEVDEAVLPLLLKQVRPSIVLLHNLFRDQLDRYGEVDGIARHWQEALHDRLPTECALLVNADDPNLAYVAQQCGHGRTLYYGLDSPESGTAEPSSAVDAYLSPASGIRLNYRTYYLSHLGDYYDDVADFRRPELSLAATSVSSRPHGAGSNFSLSSRANDETVATSLPLAGLYNVYNALAASLAANTLSVDLQSIGRTLPLAAGVFGRFERLSVNGRELVFCLIKNPVGATEVFRTVSQDSGPYSLALFANDNFADGQDVSWYWDADFELLASTPASCLCSGLRARDMALRMKYAGYPSSDIVVEPAIPAALEAVINDTSSPISYVLATYTATIELQSLLAKRGIKQAYWQE